MRNAIDLIPILTTGQMRAIDADAIGGDPSVGYSYMSKAGAAVVEELNAAMSHLSRQPVAILCGKGNNGGDGYVVGRLLQAQGWAVECFGVCGGDSLSGEAAIAFREFVSAKGTFTLLHSAPDPAAFGKFGLIVDALLGTGTKGDPRGLIAELIDFINAVGKPVVAIDTPSGLDNDAGLPGSPTVKAALTVTLGFPKIGQLFYPGREYTGELRIRSLGYPAEVVDRHRSAIGLPSRAVLRALLPRRKPAGSKFDHGLALLVCGSKGMAGSATLASQACLRSGCGMVHLASPEAAASVLQVKSLEPVIHSLPQTAEGSLAAAATDSIMELSRRMQAALIGPGLSHQAETVGVVRHLVASLSVPMVLDADGLNAFKGEGGLLKNRQAEIVITPHAGEWERLFGPVAGSPVDRLAAISAIAAEHNLCVVYKGSPTIVVGSTGQAAVVPLGNSGMATAGSGDVLAGLIAGLIAQGCSSSFEAALLGVCIHGLSGEAASRQLGEHGMIAGDLLTRIPEVIRDLAPPAPAGILPDQG
jgi:NAD(P)H-hydrate epimerase